MALLMAARAQHGAGRGGVDAMPEAGWFRSLFAAIGWRTAALVTISTKDALMMNARLIPDAIVGCVTAWCVVTMPTSG